MPQFPNHITHLLMAFRGIEEQNSSKFDKTGVVLMGILQQFNDSNNSPTPPLLDSILHKVPGLSLPSSASLGPTCTFLHSPDWEAWRVRWPRPCSSPLPSRSQPWGRELQPCQVLSPRFIAQWPRSPTNQKGKPNCSLTSHRVSYSPKDQCPVCAVGTQGMATIA